VLGREEAQEWRNKHREIQRHGLVGSRLSLPARQSSQAESRLFHYLDRLLCARRGSYTSLTRTSGSPKRNQHEKTVFTPNASPNTFCLHRWTTTGGCRGLLQN